MDDELKQYLIAMEERLKIHVDQRVEASEHRMDDGLDELISASERRLIEKMRDMQSELLGTCFALCESSPENP